eukprot:CAMPEP_0182491466 /NCGR_PEP_ID=MMETSP1321-20130603/897_1 /TAXON_ID=91990 /ORGANISM="Bolidomonas sp., Strain RCC1657" /LENGTH=380 /DNA_ID=CAMNT_0024693747 /DNA_START=66 /DNA_END=1205 /DNA_ORIENTATION=-
MTLIYPIGVPFLYWRLLEHAQSKLYLDPGQHNLVGKKAWKRQDVGEEKWEFILMDVEGEEKPSDDEPEVWKKWEKVESVSEDEALEFAIYIRSKIEEEHPTLMRMSFLYSMYEPWCYNFEVKETVRKLILTGGLIFFNPGTASQIVVSMLMCLGSIRTYTHYKPFVDPKTDIIAEIAQWSLFFVMFGALLIRLNMDGESLQDRGYFDVILVIVNLTPLLLPVIQQLAILRKLRSVQILSAFVSQVGAYFGFGGDVIAAKKQMEELQKKFGLVALSKKRGGGDEETGMELVQLDIGAVTLGGGQEMPRTSKSSVANPLRDTPMAAGVTTQTTVKNKADAGRPNSSFDALKNPALKGASKNKNKKNGGVVVAKLENEIVEKG